MRQIAEVAAAVTKGNFTRSITVAAAGEVGALKGVFNEMIYNLNESVLKVTQAKEAAEAVKRTFLTNISYEIRTPVSENILFIFLVCCV